MSRWQEDVEGTPESATLPVRALVLYTHGVGHVLRAGEVDGVAATLRVRAEDLDDALKTLTVIDRAGGQVLGVEYATPLRTSDRGRGSGVSLSPGVAVRGTLGALVGRRVRVRAQGRPEATGRLIGLDEEAGEDREALEGLPWGDRTGLAVLDDTGTAHLVRLGDVTDVHLLDDDARADVAVALDAAAEGSRPATLTVRLTPGRHDLVVGHTVPSPAWRVSYRVVATPDDPQGTVGTALLQGWAVVDNPLEDDLEDVALTLVAGRPTSFRYALSASRVPARPDLTPDRALMPTPSSHGERRSFGARMASEIEAWDGAPLGVTPLAAPPPLDAADLAASTAAAADTRAAGESFAYEVAAPVTIGRGGSALVPVVARTVPYRRRLVHVEGRHPVAELVLEVPGDITLETGPAVVLEAGDYRGEAVLPFVRDGGDVRLAYAVELGVVVMEDSQRTVDRAAVRVRGALLVVEDHETTSSSYVLENRTSTAVVVLVERRIDARWTLVGESEPVESTAELRRWRVDVAAGGIATLTVVERRLLSRQERIEAAGAADLARWLREERLDAAAAGRLRDILAAVERHERASERLEALASDRAAVADGQNEQRRTLTALGPAEASLRARVVARLEALQDRLDSLDSEEERLRVDRDEARAEADRLIRGPA